MIKRKKDKKNKNLKKKFDSNDKKNLLNQSNFIDDDINIDSKNPKKYL